VKRKSHAPKGARLFSEPHAPADVHLAHVDGAARGNPGPASYAVIIHDAAGREVYRLGKAIGRNTNNVAEYHGLIAALDYAATHGLRRLRIRSDSELLVRQMQGLYKVKSADLKPLHERAQKLARGLEYFAIEHVRRELNSDADALANEALDGSRNARVGAPLAAPDDAPVGAGFSQPFVRRSSSPEGASGAAHKSGGLKPAPTSRRIRAIYRNGALHPAEPLDLPDGASVDLTLHKPE
jgi:ribonuclease HI